MRIRRIECVVIVGAAVCLTGALMGADDPTNKELARQIFETMIKLPGNDPHQRPVHAKGLVSRRDVSYQ